jgi:hypothetical protein
MNIFLLLLKLLGSLSLRLLALGKKLLLLFSLNLSSFLVFGMAGLFSFFETYSLGSLNLLLKVCRISFLNHSELLFLGGVADTPSLSHTANFSLKLNLFFLRLSLFLFHFFDLVFGFLNPVLGLPLSSLNEKILFL